ncbi:MAG: tetratricopeptide repeat protein [Bacteroidia bacterium]|nr:tetratricopeptide repeat protein [Bacteroidia bacterium]
MKKPYSIPFFGVALALLLMVFLAYQNHFDNPFHFDDDHTIVKNSSLDTLDIGRFLTDPTAFSTLPANQAWRPGMTITNSIDTILSDGTPDPVVFHIHIFILYLILGVLLYFFILHLLKKCFPSIEWTNWIALLSTGFYMLHTANAETINYISARSDSQSTLFIILAFNLYFYWEKGRKYYIYLLPIAYGFLIKETAIMFAPMLLVYHLLFVRNESNRNLVSPGIIVSFILAAVLFLISRKMTLSTWTSGGADPLHYLFTQSFVIVHYLYTFILPVNLSADTDWAYFSNLFDTRVFAGAFILGTLIVAGIRWSFKEETKAAAFGIAWFFIALAPTSSIFSFAEVMNDHRVFFPYIGLILVVANFAVIGWRRINTESGFSLHKMVALGFTGFLLTAHMIGTRERCEVWGSGESLWKDVTIKSPENGRGWMNYGNALMARGNVDSAIIVFQKALDLAPGYAYAKINMGVALSRKNMNAEAERYYKEALAVDPGNPEPYYYYADFLIRTHREKEAIPFLRTGHEKSPGHQGINNYLAFYDTPNFVSALDLAKKAATEKPTPENYVNLSLQYYLDGQYMESALAAEKAAEMKSDYGLAYNNICAAYNKLGQFDKAIEAGQKAVQLLPTDEMSRNNLAEAQRQKAQIESLKAAVDATPTHDTWLNLSLGYYNVGNYAASRDAAQEAVKIDPKSAAGYNNICAACTQLKDKQCAIDAGTKAVELNPEWELAKNNLAAAQALK